MGTAHKGNSSNGNRGRASYSFGLMLLLAFGAALLGVMVVHKLRERRIFNLLVKEKDRELLSLHLLLQKERENNKEMKRKAEEMKSKVYFLRTQEMELDRRLLEMQSTIDSLKDEQKTMESTLEEKQNEIKMLRDRDIDTGRENPLLIALTESLKQKEAKIDNLKRRLGNSVKVWSVSTDDPSNLPANLTETESITQRDKEEDRHESTNYRDRDTSMKGDGAESKPTNFREGDNITKVEEGSENRVGISVGRDTTREEESMVETLQENLRNGGAAGEKSTDAEETKDSAASSAGGEKNIAYGTEAVIEIDGKVMKARDEGGDVKTMDGQEHKITTDGQLGKPGNSQENQQASMGGIKLELTENSGIGAGLRLRGKHGHLSKAKGRKWRILAKNRRLEKNGNSESNGVTSVASGRSKNDQNGVRNREGGTTSTSEKAEIKDGGIGENMKAVDINDARLVKSHNLEHAEDLENRIVNNNIIYQMEKQNEVLEKPSNDMVRGVLRNGRIDAEAINFASHLAQQNMNSRDIKELESKAERMKVAEKQEIPETTEVEDIQEPEKEDSFMEFVSDLEEDKGEYKEETDESVF